MVKARSKSQFKDYTSVWFPGTAFSRQTAQEHHGHGLIECGESASCITRHQLTFEGFQDNDPRQAQGRIPLEISLLITNPTQ